jgi:DNA-binding winged helix-turn-helix (wHTH) protein
VSGNPSSGIIRFSTFEADLQAGEVRRQGQKLKLQEQPFQVLAMLLERPGEVVTREELRIKLWPADTFVDFDHGLNAAMKRLRDALGESAEKPIFIETLDRRGYRFIAPVEKLDDSGHFMQAVSRHGDSESSDRSEELKGIARLKRRIGISVAAVCLGAGVVAAKFWPGSELKALRSRDSSQLTVGQANDHDVVAPAALRLFWSGFISREQEPLVIFSNAKFVGQPEISLHYYDAKRDGKDAVIFDHYTGVGETIAVHELDRAFNLMHHEIRVKRGSLLELDDAKNNDLIFVGSPMENLSLLEIPGTQEFVFHRIDSGPRKGDPGLVNVHPQPGEPKEFLSSPHGDGLTEDYGVIALLRGLDSDHSVLILAGNTTMSTQAAVEFVCHPNSINTLLRRISGSANGHLKPFEAVIHVKVSRGVPISSELVALRGGTS